MRNVYLDNNATSPLLPKVFEAMVPYFIEGFGNASSIYERGQQAKAAVERARQSLAQLIGAEASEIVFTGGGTEGDNLALFGLVSPGDHIITSKIEHHAILNSCKRLEALGSTVTYLPVTGLGQVDPDTVRAALKPNTKLISIMMANNETGAVQPLEAIGKIAAEADVLFHTDAVQAEGKIAIDVDRIGCDLLTISGHKLHGPQGTGVLYARKGVMLQPLLLGGPQEGGKRAGTENLAGIVGLGVAAVLAGQWLAAGNADKMAALRNRLERTITEQVGLTNINSAEAPRVPNTTNIIFESISGVSLVVELDLEGVSVSTGSACSSNSSDPPYVLTAMGLTLDQAYSAIRFSLGKLTTEEDINYALECIPRCVAKLRETSPLWKKCMAATAGS
jgi:cysteine desulfurase